MSDADDAYEAARRLIAEAKAKRAERLDLARPETRALTRLPPEIAGLDTVRLLVLDGTDVTDLSPLSGLMGLTGLWLDNTGVTDLSPLSGLTGLTELSLNGTGVTDLSPLSGLAGLTELWLERTDATDLSPLSGLTGLAWLRLDNSAALDLRPLRELVALTRNPENGQVRGLRFKNCAAARADPRIAEIAEIKHPAERARTLFDYLEDSELPPEVKDLPEQSDAGLRYRVSKTRKLEYDPRPADVPIDEALEQFHAILQEDAGALARVCSGGPNLMYQPLADKVDRYRTALGNGPTSFAPALLWKTGNDLRLILRSDDQRTLDDLDGMPRLGPDQRMSLEGLVSTHNVFSDLHPVLSKLDISQIDPAERHRAMQNMVAIEAALDALASQLLLVHGEIVADLRGLHAEAQGEADAALRAMRIERESLENLIKAIVAQGLVETKDPALLKKVGGDLRAWTLGAAAGALGPEVAANYPQLVAALHPHISTLLAAWHGKDYPVAKVVEWIVARVRAKGDEKGE